MPTHSCSTDKTSSFINHFSNLTDPRRTNKGHFLHPLTDILFLVISGVLSGANDWQDIVIFGNNQLDWLKKYGSYQHGIPSSDTLKRLFSALDPLAFNTCFMNWVNSISQLSNGEVVAIDGKTIRGTKTDKLPHIVSAYASANELTLGQVKVDNKSNEITAIPILINMLEIEKAVITTDAMGCQKQIAETIIKKGADYLLAVKDNQKTLKLNILDTIKLEKPDSQDIRHTLDHGRVETRQCFLYSNLSHLKNKNNWRQLKNVVHIKTEVFHKKSKKTTIEERFYISSLDQDASQINAMVPSHWSVENNLHWTLDVLFRKDYSRKRKGNSAENFNIILKIALGLIVKEKTQKKRKRLLAALDQGYREKLLNLA